MPNISFDNTENAFRYRSDKELKKAQFLFATMAYPNVAALGMSLAKLSVKWNLPFKRIVKNTIYKQFCGGETLDEIVETTEKLGRYGVACCLDYGAEGVTSEEGFDQTVIAFEETIRFAADRDNIPFIPIKITAFAHHELLEKKSSGATLSQEEQEAWKRTCQRVDRICRLAADKGLMILIDAEESWIQQAVDDLADEMMAKYNKDKVYIFNTYQMYRHDRLAFIKSSLAKAQQQGYLLGVKIVRGAYMEKERARAAEKGYISPIQPNKEATDRDYNAAIDFCFEHLDKLALFIGTHNEYSSLKAVEEMEKRNLSPQQSPVYFSQLYGMSDNITFNLAAAGYHASKYLPYGPLKEVIPYLMRRAQENTSVAGQTGRELFLINKEVKRRKSAK